jgi:hypothetical protein
MAKFVEWDIDNPAHRRRSPQIIEGEVLSSALEPRQQPRTISFDRRRNVRVPRWAVALLAIGVLAMLFPVGLVVGFDVSVSSRRFCRFFDCRSSNHRVGQTPP